jgi:glucose-6-phosphate isomerase
MKVEELLIEEPTQTIVIHTGEIAGSNVSQSIKKIKELPGIFADEQAWQATDPETIVYKVQVHAPVERNTEGGLLFGTTWLMPGKIGSEYFLTQGHFHEIGNRAEYYWGIEGEGVLLLMDKSRVCRAERMYPGSLHYIPADTAHRVANCGNGVLSFGACWPADAGYDYDEIRINGFSARLIEADGVPVLVPA